MFSEFINAFSKIKFKYHITLKYYELKKLFPRKLSRILNIKKKIGIQKRIKNYNKLRIVLNDFLVCHFSDNRRWLIPLERGFLICMLWEDLRCVAIFSSNSLKFLRITRSVFLKCNTVQSVKTESAYKWKLS